MKTLYAKKDFLKKYFFKNSNLFFRWKKKFHFFRLLDRCEIFWRIHFSHPRSDLTSISSLTEQEYKNIPNCRWFFDEIHYFSMKSAIWTPKCLFFFRRVCWNLIEKCLYLSAQVELSGRTVHRTYRNTCLLTLGSFLGPKSAIEELSEKMSYFFPLNGK